MRVLGWSNSTANRFTKKLSPIVKLMLKNEKEFAATKALREIAEDKKKYTDSDRAEIEKHLQKYKNGQVDTFNKFMKLVFEES